MGLSRLCSHSCRPSLTLRSRLRRRGKDVVQSIKWRVLDIINAIRDVALAVDEKSRLIPLIAEVADLLAADVKMGAIDKVTARHQRCYVAIEIAPLRRASGDLIGLRCVFLSSVIDIIALSLDPLSGQESVVIVDTADVKRGIRLATVTWASLNRVVSRNKGRLCRLPGDRAWSRVVWRRGGIISWLRILRLDV